MTYTPKSPVLNEHWQTGGFVVSEANGYRSRESGIYVNGVASQVALDGGLVVTAANLGTAVIAATSGNTGTGTLGTLTFGGAIMEGAYTVAMTSATAFTVTRPDGVVVGSGVAGAAFASKELGFLVTAGTTAFVAGDSFSITVNHDDIGYTSWTGTGIPRAILYNRTVVPASSSLKVTLLARDAEVNLSELQWDSAVTSSASVAALQASARDALQQRGIIAR